MLNQADNKVIYKCDKGSFGHSYYTMIDKSGKTERNLFMYLRVTETSKRYGYNQPRTYIDINPENNYSSIDNHGSKLCFFNKMVNTQFYRVRVIIIRLKNKRITENIDCADTTYIKSTEDEPMIQRGINNSNYAMYDSALYCHAINFNDSS